MRAWENSRSELINQLGMTPDFKLHAGSSIVKWTRAADVNAPTDTPPGPQITPLRRMKQPYGPGSDVRTTAKLAAASA